jgi:hypothetical protein
VRRLPVLLFMMLGSLCNALGQGSPVTTATNTSVATETPSFLSSRNSILFVGSKGYEASSDLGTTLTKMIGDLPQVGGYSSGLIVIPGGSYRQSSEVRLESPYLSVIGIGSGSVQITCTLASDCWRVNTNPFTTTQAGKIGGFTLIGEGEKNSANGIHMGDIIGLQLDDIRVTGFTGPGSAGLWLDNVTGFTERTVLTKVHLDGNTKNIRFTVNGGDGSFGYNRFLDLRINVNQDQIGFSMESGSLYHSVVIATINGGAVAAGHTKVFISLTGTSAWEQNSYSIMTEDTVGGGGFVLSTSPGTKFSGQGLLDNYNHPGGPPMTNSIGGSIDIYPALFLTSAPSLLPNDVNGTLSARQKSTAVGTSLMPDTGAAGNFLEGIGLNFWFDGANWIANGDGLNNGGMALLATDSGRTGLGFYAIPSSGGGPQMIPTAALGHYLVGSVDPSGTATFSKYASAANCSSRRSPANCGPAPVGSVAIPPSSNSLVVETSAVTRNSQIIATFDASLGQRLRVRCYPEPLQPAISARVAGKSFTLTVPAAPRKDPACLSYVIIN